jgi:hypothetical protein
MAITAATVLTEAKGLLNDPSGYIYPDDKLIPLLQKAYGELQTKMMLNGLPVLKEQTTPIVVNAGVVALADGALLPTDLVYPIELAERASGSTELFVDMTETDWEPTAIPTNRLNYWNWREEEIKFLGATVNREVRIRYMKGLTRITATTTPVTILNSTTFLGARCATIAAFVIGNNPARATALSDDAGSALSDLLAILVKRGQGLPVRRRVNRFRR